MVEVWLCFGTDGTDLVFSDPNTSMRRSGGFQSKLFANGDDGLLQFTHVPANALREMQHQHVLGLHFYQFT